MKSMARCNHGLWGVGSRTSLPVGSVHSTLALAQTLMKQQQNLSKSRKHCSYLTVVGTGQFVTAGTMSWSISTPSGPMM